MSSKPKFNPEVTRIRLNPEQAVLACSCYTNGRANRGGASTARATVCYTNDRRSSYCRQNANAISS